MKKKILVILGTRPEIVRLSCIVKKLEKNFNTILVNSNQNFDKNLNKVFFENFNYKKPKYSLAIKNYKNPINFLSIFFNFIDQVFQKEKPDAVVILGDTNTALSAICAKKRKIPIFHLEAGNRCFDNRVPEEINRVLVDRISDINLVYSDVAKQNLIKENFDLDKVIKIGSPLYEVFNSFDKKIKNSKILGKLKLNKKQYMLVSCHREENVDSYQNLKNIFLAIEKISLKHRIKVLFSLHPRTKSKLKNFPNKILKSIIFHKPFGFFDYINLQINSKLIISDSGSIIEESNILNLPSINLRETTERQEGFEKSFSIMSGLKSDDIFESAEIVIKKFNNHVNEDLHPDYMQKNVSDRVVTIIQSYINYINQKTWYKY